ncbi:MAG: hypothetical protein MJ082_00210 [Clostridia bacterium]|nr:hypothetical protein [Clostridia bacterium]
MNDPESGIFDTAYFILKDNPADLPPRTVLEEAMRIARTVGENTPLRRRKRVFLSYVLTFLGGVISAILIFAVFGLFALLKR